MLFSNSVSYGFARARDVGLSAPSPSASRPPSAVGVHWRMMCAAQRDRRSTFLQRAGASRGEAPRAQSRAAGTERRVAVRRAKAPKSCSRAMGSRPDAVVGSGRMSSTFFFSSLIRDEAQRGCRF